MLTIEKYIYEGGQSRMKHYHQILIVDIGRAEFSSPNVNKKKFGVCCGCFLWK
jgi:hypothetical protein